MACRTPALNGRRVPADSPRLAITPPFSWICHAGRELRPGHSDRGVRARATAVYPAALAQDQPLARPAVRLYDSAAVSVSFSWCRESILSLR